MGLFRRRAETQAELDNLRNELRTMRERLDETDRVKVRLAERVGQLDEENQRLNSQVGTVETLVDLVESRVGSVDNKISSVDNKISTVDNKISTVENKVVDVESHVSNVEASVGEQRAQIADVALVATDAAERTEQAEAKLAATPVDATPERHLDDETRAQIGRLAEKVAALDSRVNQVSVELTNQLSELSDELDRASTDADSDNDPDKDTMALIERLAAQLDDVTGGQERLASEQARYAIQFREDLAELADRLRRPNAR